MTTTRRWTLLGLLMGVALAAGIMFATPEWLDGIATNLGADRLSPLAAPPLGMTARIALAAGLLLAATALGWLIGRLSAPSRDTQEEQEPASEFAAVGPSHAASVEDLGWRAPAGAAPAEPVATATVSAPLPAAVAMMPVPDDTSTDQIPAGPPAPMPTEPLSAELPRVEAAPADAPPAESVPVSVDPVAPAQAAAVPAETIARLEAAVAELARHTPARAADRFDGIDARLQQMAQQIAELAALARAAQRTPSGPALPSPVASMLVAPADPAHRRAMAGSARALLARLDEHVGRA